MVIETDVNMPFSVLNAAVRESTDKEITINGCIGQRYIATNARDKKIIVNGTPGNALGAYLDGGNVIVHGNCQDAVGDTMNSGMIIIHGNTGDATGYAMRGGKIYIRGNTGYRAGIHMKEFMASKPVLVVGGRAGSFLGEYQAGGVIVVLGMHTDGLPIVNHFTGMGMHGGVMYLRCKNLPYKLPPQIRIEKTKGRDIPELVDTINDYCIYFDCFSARQLISDDFCMLTPDVENPYEKLYVDNR